MEIRQKISRGAKEAGVKIIAVATGKYSLDELKKESPDYLFENFGDVCKIIEVIQK